MLRILTLCALPAIVDARAVAVNKGAGTAFAHALAVGVVHGKESAKAFVEAVAILLEGDGCEKFKPTLVGKLLYVLLLEQRYLDFPPHLSFASEKCESKPP